MNRWLLGKMLNWGERQVGGVQLDYAWHLRDVLPSHLWRFSLIKAVEGPRRYTPPEAWHAAGLARLSGSIFVDEVHGEDSSAV